jgi:hypothetical protein
MTADMMHLDVEGIISASDFIDQTDGRAAALHLTGQRPGCPLAEPREWR